ncbi:MAG: hypothetical protein IJW32_03370 [Clostridia bacterium]|nr:hypothetical protein [Clostridia bacterium]
MREFESRLLRQEEPYSNIRFFYFCIKGVAGFVVPTQKVQPKQSMHYLNIKRDEHGNWIK